MNTNDFFNGLGETLAKKAKELGGHVEVFYDRQKLRGQILVEKRDIDKIRGEIGDVIYKSYKAGADLDEELKALCEEIDLHQERINNMKDNIAENQGKRICPHCQASVDSDALFCPTCGEALPDEPEADAFTEDLAETVEETAEAAEVAVEEAAEAAAEAAEEAVENVAEAVEEATKEE